MERTYHIIRGTVILATFLVGLVWFLIAWLNRSRDDPGRLIAKWVVSSLMILVIGAAALTAGPFAPLLVLPPSIILAIMWAPNIGATLASPLTNAIDGGDVAPEEKALYSIAQSHRIHSRFPEAIAEIEKQLERYPQDFEGQMLLASIQVENLGNLAAAEAIIEQILEQKRHTPGQVFGALSTLADWHLKYGESRAAARADFERARQLFPNTDLALMASQRIASLSGEGGHKSEGHQIFVQVGSHEIGLHVAASPEPPQEESPATIAGNYVKHLKQHPDDWSTREKLAAIYMEHYHRLDMAVGELEQLIATPHQNSKNVVRWLNTIADYQVAQSDIEAARKTLQRISDLYPRTAAATQADSRKVRLMDTSKAKRSGGLVLGNYDKDIGLKS